MTNEKELEILRELEPRMLSNAALRDRIVQLRELIQEEHERERAYVRALAICERRGHVYVEMYQDGRDTPVVCTRCRNIDF